MTDQVMQRTIVLTTEFGQRFTHKTITVTEDQAILNTYRAASLIRQGVKLKHWSVESITACEVDEFNSPTEATQ